MSFPITSCVLMSFLFSRLSISSYRQKKSTFEFDLKSRLKFSEEKKSLLEIVYSITMDRFSQEGSKGALESMKIFEKKLKNVRDLEASTNQLNKTLGDLSYLDLNFREDLEKKPLDLMDSLNLELPSWSLYKVLSRAKVAHVKEGLKYLEAPLEIIALPDLQAILRDNKISLPRSSFLFFENTLRGVFPTCRKKLNEGAFSEVFSVTMGRSSFAYKKVKGGVEVFKRQLKEACLYMLLKHRNITAIEAISPEGLYLEIAKGDLFDIYDKKLPSPQELKRVFQEIARAVSYIHRSGFIYKDLKLDNILFEETALGIRTFLCDFEFVVPAEGDRVRNGSAVYIAPEVWEGRGPYSQKVDSFAFGVIMCYLIMRRHPFLDYDNEDVILDTIVRRVNKPCKVEALMVKLHEAIKNQQFLLYAKPTYTQEQLNDAVSHPFKDFMTIAARCLHGDPIQRISMEQILEDLENIPC